MRSEDTMRYNVEGDKAVKKAQASIKGNFFGNIFSSKNQRVEEALDLYKKGLDNYKLAKNWVECAAINQECAMLSKSIGEERDAAGYSAEAGDFLMKAKEEERAVQMYKEAVECFKKNGSFDQAANLLNKIGEYYEKEVEPELAADYYKSSADMYSLAKFHQSDSTKLRKKVADIYSQQFESKDKLKEAIKLYEELAEEHLGNNLMRFHAKDLLVKATIIFLVLDDDIGAEKSLDKYSDMDPNLNNSYDAKFLRSLIKACRDTKPEEFSDAVAQMMKRTTIENPVKQMLGYIKQHMTSSKAVAEPDNPL